MLTSDEIKYFSWVSANFMDEIRKLKYTVDSLESENCFLKSILKEQTELLRDYTKFCSKKGNQFKPDKDYKRLEKKLLSSKENKRARRKNSLPIRKSIQE